MNRRAVGTGRGCDFGRGGVGRKNGLGRRNGLGKGNGLGRRHRLGPVWGLLGLDLDKGVLLQRRGDHTLPNGLCGVKALEVVEEGVEVKVRLRLLWLGWLLQLRGPLGGKRLGSYRFLQDKRGKGKNDRQTQET